MRMNAPPIYRTLLVALLTALSACGGQVSDEIQADKISLCASNADCNGELICHAKQFCTLPPEQQTSRKVSFVFSPTAESGQLAQRSPVLEASTSTPLDFVLEPSIPVIGVVSNASGQRIQSGTLIFTPRTDLNGVLRRQTEINDENLDIAGEDANFTIDLLPGTYDITFISGSDAIPNRRWRGQVIGDSLTSLSLVLPPNSAITTIEGTISHQDPDLDLEPALSRLPVQGARVQAVAANGTTSTASVTDEQGNYSIRVWSDNGVHDLRVGPATPNAPIPQYIQEDAFDASSGIAQAIAVDLGTWSTQRFELRIMLLEQMLGEQGRGLDFSPGEARLILTGRLPDGKALTFYSSPNSEEPLTLLPIPYTVSLVPPPTSKFGVLTFDWNPLTQNSFWRDSTLELPMRRELRAQVTDAYGAPISNARIELKATTAVASKSDSPSSAQAIETETRELTAQTDSKGMFTAWVEPGWSYQLTVIPSSQGEAPMGRFLVEADSTTDTTEYIFALPKPVLVSGSINRLEGESLLAPLGDTSFQIYDEESTPPRQIGQGRTSADGTFRVLLPAPQN